MVRKLHERSWFLLVILVTIAFGWIILPFFGAILWGVVAAVMFMPLNRKLRVKLGGRKNLAALLSLLTLTTLVITPALLLGSALIQEAGRLYERLQSGVIDFDSYFAHFQAALPNWAHRLLDRVGFSDLATIRERLGGNVASSVQALAGRALNIGQSAFQFVISLSVMLYLSFFLLRDGDDLARQVKRAAPVSDRQQTLLIQKFVTVIRATIKGSLVVALVQGAIGGITFWALGIPLALLWGVLMAFMSLLPAIGTGVVWVPVALYLFAIGSVWQGIVLVVSGVLVIGMVDNVLRPILVGRDAKMPDYVVLISTLGGISVMGVNGLLVGPVIAAMFIAVWESIALLSENADRPGDAPRVDGLPAGE